MSDQWTGQLSEYLDGELDAEAQASLEAHLERCPECREALAGLRRVLARVHAVEDRMPVRELWPGIAERIGARPPVPVRRLPRRYAFSLPQLAAAGIALATLSGSSVWLLRPAATRVMAVQPAPAPPTPPAAVLPVASGAARPAAGGPRYDAAVADLERILRDGRGRLDSTTVRVLERNLALIDAAILQARRAVAADSANLYLNSHLAETMRRKVELLRQAASLVATAS
jgi:hypothetical protein